MTERAEIHSFLQDHQAASIDRLVQWCEMNSGSFEKQNLDTMAERLKEDFGLLGLQGEAIELPEFQQISSDGSEITRQTGPLLRWNSPNFGEVERRRVLLMIHYDTVYPDEGRPHLVERGSNHLVGPGTADAKGGIAVIYAAIQAVTQLQIELGVDWSVVLNPDEEIGSTASVRWMRRHALEFDVGLLFEPKLPGGAFAGNRAGSGNFVYVVHGKSAHAGRNPLDGRNAVLHAASLATSIPRLFEDLDDSTVNVGRIGGGGPNNQVPDLATVHLNVRCRKSESVAVIEERLKQLASDFNREDDGYRCECKGKFHAPPKIADDTAIHLRQLIQTAGSAVGETIQFKDTGGACDGSKLAAFGLPNVDTMGLRGGNLHSAEEFCEPSSLVPAAATLIETLGMLGQEAE